MALHLGSEGMLRLTVPLDESTDLRGLTSEYLRDQHRVLIGWLRVWSQRSGDEGARQLLSEIRRLKKSNPGVVLGVLRRCAVGGLLRCIYGLLKEGTWSSEARRWSVELQCQIAFELWMAEALEAEVVFRSVPPRFVASDCRQVVDLSEEAVTGLRFLEGGLELEIDGEWRGRSREFYWESPESPESPVYWDVVDGVTLTVADNNPLALFETHPDKNGNYADLGGKPPEEWVTMLVEALGLIEEYFPELYQEMRLSLFEVIPVGYSEDTHLSASYQEYIGSIYVTLHPNVMTMVEALIHEFSHTKINMLFSLDSVLHNAFAPLYPSPYRPDPRPLHGVLLGLHAFLPIEYLYDRLETADHLICGDPNWGKRRGELRDLDRDAAAVVVANGEGTEIGGRLVAELAYWNEHFESGREVPKEGEREAVRT